RGGGSLHATNPTPDRHPGESRDPASARHATGARVASSGILAPGFRRGDIQWDCAAVAHHQLDLNTATPSRVPLPLAGRGQGWGFSQGTNPTQPPIVIPA